MYVRIRNERDAISFANAAPTTLLRRVLKCLFARFSNFFFFFFCFIKSLLLLYIGTFKSAHLDERHHGVVDAHSFPSPSRVIPLRRLIAASAPPFSSPEPNHAAIDAQSSHG